VFGFLLKEHPYWHRIQRHTSSIKILCNVAMAVSVSELPNLYNLIKCNQDSINAT
jgi:hypothetical protein